MGLFDFFKKSNESNTSNCDETYPNIAATVEVIISNPMANWEQLVQLITEKVGDKQLAFDLYRFVPIVFCRRFINDVNFPDHYLVMNGNGRDNQFTEYKFSDNDLYKKIETYFSLKMKELDDRDQLISLLMHSSEFDAINNALNGGADIKQLELAPPVFT